MKSILLLTVLLFGCFLQLSAQQHPLVGTWEFVSGKGTNAEGKTISFDNSKMRETKIFSPTHFIYILLNVKGDSLVFNRSFAGTWKVEGNKYIETPTMGSQEGFDQVKTDFTWKVEGDKFIRQGTIIQPNGQKITIDALVFQKVRGNNATNNPLVGTWNQLSSSFTQADGTKNSVTNATHSRFQIISPTHWMSISYKDNKYESAMGGAYTMEGNKAYPKVEWASFPINTAEKLEVTSKVAGDKMYMSGAWMDAKGNMVRSFEDVFQRIGAKSKMAKATFIK